LKELAAMKQAQPPNDAGTGYGRLPAVPPYPYVPYGVPAGQYGMYDPRYDCFLGCMIIIIFNRMGYDRGYERGYGKSHDSDCK
jgi:hypothetical protein